ncbi:Transcriptional regulator, LysR family [Labilithrix luteola]|uniref:Transcriptional regulator, LysR family n=1 Tax=Labilithrix luteola TaxID=1391654 RepID=A0A0K1QFQ8_9BACT|nr:LysR family transcriptional regulator [Labilithrix luteola]AKV04492.1 Transcriptional regulator, LysR family [Labilithrix luteola]
MTDNYGRDLDLNLLRVFAVVAESGGVTAAAQKLYLTQPGVSAALRRLQTAMGAPLFARQGRGLTLTRRGEQLLTSVKPHLRALTEAALKPAAFDPKTSDRTLRLGMSDATEGWLLPALVRVLGNEAPSMKVIAIPVQFRSVGEAIATRAVDMAVTVADEMPAGTLRKDLFWGGFVLLFDPRHNRIGAEIREAEYFAKEHVVVSYNGDLRGVVEDMFHKSRRVRCSVSTFSHVGALVDDTPLLATVPTIVASYVRETKPHLATAKLPFGIRGASLELLWPAALDDDDACRFVREKIEILTKDAFARSRELEVRPKRKPKKSRVRS